MTHKNYIVLTYNEKIEIFDCGENYETHRDAAIY